VCSKKQNPQIGLQLSIAATAPSGTNIPGKMRRHSFATFSQQIGQYLGSMSDLFQIWLSWRSLRAGLRPRQSLAVENCIRKYELPIWKWTSLRGKKKREFEMFFQDSNWGYLIINLTFIMKSISIALSRNN